MNRAIFNSEANTGVERTLHETRICTRQVKIATAEIVIDRNIALARDRKLSSSFDDYIFQS